MTDFIKNNILLCEFDGKEYRQSNDQDICLFDYEYNVIDYSSDWNLLMSVLIKADNSFTKNWGLPIKHNYFAFIATIDSELKNYEIVPVFYEVIKFIEWYNLQPKKP